MCEHSSTTSFSAVVPPFRAQLPGLLTVENQACFVRFAFLALGHVAQLSHIAVQLRHCLGAVCLPSTDIKSCAAVLVDSCVSQGPVSESRRLGRDPAFKQRAINCPKTYRPVAATTGQWFPYVPCRAFKLSQQNCHCAARQDRRSWRQPWARPHPKRAGAWHLVCHL